MTKVFSAVIADMDGVLTATAKLHELAWKRMFDSYLQSYQQRTGQEQRTFSSEDYRAFVDGKPRYDGVTDFLASRNITLPHGEPSDSPEQETVCGLGNRKNEFFLKLLEQEGVEVFDDAVSALKQWRREGMKLAAVSASRNCQRVLRAAGLVEYFDVIVGGQLAQDLGLRGKREIFLEAATRLGVQPADAVVLEDAVAGVRAAKDAGFGLVVGIDREQNEANLQDAGADKVVTSVSDVPLMA